MEYSVEHTAQEKMAETCRRIIHDTLRRESLQYKDNTGKARLDLVPTGIGWAIARVREFGVMKYPDGGVNNWKRVPVQDYTGAMLRHIYRYMDDPNGVDEESGLPHLWHAACNMAFIIELTKGDSFAPKHSSSDGTSRSHDQDTPH